jgi:hypothetical protein
VTTSDDAPNPADRSVTPRRRTEATSDGSITTGILEAERRARDDVARRRRLLVGGAVLGLVIAGAVLAVMTVLQQQANREAELASDLAEARADFAEAVVERAEDYEPPARAVEEDARALRAVLEQFLTTTETSDGELGRQVEVLLVALDADAAAVAELRARDVPEPAEVLDPTRAVIVLRELETLRAEADALADEVPLARNDVRTWLGVVRDVNEAVAAHIEQVEAEESTSDPQELIELWRAERPALLRLSAAASAADDVAGLAAWADAHEAYARDLLDWIDEAVELLQEGEIAAYNERFDELFATDDPFGFNAAVAAATEEALASPALLQLGTLEQRAQLVLDRITSTEVVTAEQLDGRDDA